MLLDKWVGGLPEGHATPVAHVVAGVESDHAVELLIDHDDREGVASTVVLNLRRCLLTNCQHYVGCLVAIGIDQLVVGIDRHEVDLSHTHGRHYIHVPAEFELDAARTCLAVEHNAEVGAYELVLVLRVEEPALTLALVVSLLGLAEIALIRILDAANLALYIG